MNSMFVTLLSLELEQLKVYCKAYLLDTKPACQHLKRWNQ